jgi:hypothetical protein
VGGRSDENLYHVGWWYVMATLYPEDFAAEVTILLDLASDPRDVKTTTDGPRLGVIIPDELLERYQAYQSASETPKKRGPGRPRKNPLPEQESSP